MKVLIINGSPRLNGNCSKLIDEMVNIFEQEGIEVENYQIGSKAFRGCMACGYCYENHECVFKDDVNQLAKIFNDSDGLVVVSPVYYGSANGSLISLLDRMFYSSQFDKRFKVGANGFGREKEQIEKDEEGLQNARVVARNMVFLMKAIKDAKKKYGYPEMEENKFTHFIK